jgi:hypothetical protein
MGQFNNILESLVHLTSDQFMGLLRTPILDKIKAFEGWLNDRVLCGCQSFLDLASVYIEYGGGKDRCAIDMVGPEPIECPPEIYNELVPFPDEYGRAFDKACRAVEGVCDAYEVIAIRGKASAAKESKLAAGIRTAANKLCLSKEALALAALKDHPEWTDSQIAKAAGCKRTSLYDMPAFVKAKAMLKVGKKDLPKGRKDKDGRVEAWEKDDEDDNQA